MAAVEDVRELGSSLERSHPVYVRGRLKFRVEQIVYVAFSLDETEMGFGFPKEERAALVAARPDRFHLPRPSDLRFNWVEADLAVLDPAEAREFVVDAIAGGTADPDRIGPALAAFLPLPSVLAGTWGPPRAVATMAGWISCGTPPSPTVRPRATRPGWCSTPPG